jgi:hypothetical protein
MASSLSTKLRIAGSVLFATGFFDAVAGRFLFQSRAQRDRGRTRDHDDPVGGAYADLAGALHIHSTYSDGGGDILAVMAGACEAGVDFVLLTDHNTQRPLRDGWERRYEKKPVLLIGTEVTVEQGAFLLALDMPSEWEPCKGRPPQEVIDEVNAHGGLPLISLPFDVKHPWREWDVTGCAGLEVLNLSTVARRHINIPSLLWLLPVGRRFGTRAALRALVTRPDAALARWDGLTADGAPSVGIGALDAHALMKVGKRKYPIPNYADTMWTATTHVLVPRGATDVRRAIYDALRAGRSYFAYDCLGDPRPFSFTAVAGTEIAQAGERIARGDAGRVRLKAEAARGTLLRVYFRGRVVAAGTDGTVEFEARQPGAYRIEAYRYAARVGPFYLGARPWVFSNPIYVC